MEISSLSSENDSDQHHHPSPRGWNFQWEGSKN